MTKLKKQHRLDTAANWTSANPLLLNGETGKETDTGKKKEGDGVTLWNLLPYLSESSLLTIVEDRNSDFTLASTDNKKHLTATKETAQTVTVPHNDSVEIPIGTRTTIALRGNDDFDIISELNVTLLFDENELPKIASKNNAIELIKEKINTWGLFGGLALKDNYSPWGDVLPAINDAEVSLPSFYDLHIYKSSDFPEFTTTQDYFWIGCTEHDTGAGGIIWGECDDLEFTNKVERGTILSGNQSEIPWLIRIPTSESGLISDELFLYYHTDASDPRNVSGMQETHLYTTSGGNALHLCTWNYQGKPLGNEVGESHTGYLKVYKRGVNDYVGRHLIIGGSPGTWATSYSTDGLNWTRGANMDISANMPTNVEGAATLIVPFIYNEQKYMFGQYTNDVDGTGGWAIYTHDVNYIATELLVYLDDSPLRNCHNIHFENNKMYFTLNYPTVDNHAFYISSFDMHYLNSVL